MLQSDAAAGFVGTLAQFVAANKLSMGRWPCLRRCDRAPAETERRFAGGFGHPGESAHGAHGLARHGDHAPDTRLTPSVLSSGPALWYCSTVIRN